MTIEMKDNLLGDIHLTQLDRLIDSPNFEWYLQKEQVMETADGCLLSHLIYEENVPRSAAFGPITEIFQDYLKYLSLCRITVNLLLKQKNPSISSFHTDFVKAGEPDEKTKSKITTAIFYLNTNNGYTEFESGDRIDCVRNRLVMFPTNILHRAIGQTDVNYRIVLNFNFIKCENETI